MAQPARACSSVDPFKRNKFSFGISPGCWPAAARQSCWSVWRADGPVLSRGPSDQSDCRRRATSPRPISPDASIPAKPTASWGAGSRSQRNVPAARHAAFQQQVRFTADASHELRTPLAVIHTQAQLALARPRSADDYREILCACLRSTDRMNELVDSLLLLARAHAGGLALNCGPMDLRDVAEDCVQLLRPLAARKSLTLTTDFHPAEITADAARIAQVVTNLLTNAIRYSRETGTIHVASRVESGRVTLTVADQGVGISSENLPFLFERFFRGDGARNREDGGSGLGLAICKSIVEAHGGSIACISEPGKGTTFTVRLPVEQPQRPPAGS